MDDKLEKKNHFQETWKENGPWAFIVSTDIPKTCLRNLDILDVLQVLIFNFSSCLRVLISDSVLAKPKYWVIKGYHTLVCYICFLLTFYCCFAGSCGTVYHALWYGSVCSFLELWFLVLSSFVIIEDIIPSNLSELKV